LRGKPLRFEEKTFIEILQSVSKPQILKHLLYLFVKCSCAMRK
jgi:hypothetical protein